MRKLLILPLILWAIALTACGSGNDEMQKPDTPESPATPEQPGDNPSQPSTGDEHYLVLYSSRTNTTERVANAIQKALDCDILEVEPQTPYDEDYNSMLNRAQSELAGIRNGNYPAVKTSVDNFDKYDVIFVGYPIWYGSMATPMQSFLYSHADKLKSKRIALFATSGSSGISSSVSEAKALCAEATVLDQTLLVTSSMISQMDSRVTSWLNGLGAKRESHNGSSSESTTGDNGNNLNDNNDKNSNIMKIIINDKVYTATMEDNVAAQDLLSRLPLDITLEDFNNTTEKIFSPSPALDTNGVKGGCAPVPGDITIYTPWKNVAIFCKSWSHSNDLIKIGHIDGNGINALQVSGDVKVRFER